GLAPASRRGIFITRGVSLPSCETRQNAAVAASGSSCSRRKPSMTAPCCKRASIRSAALQQPPREHLGEAGRAHLGSGPLPGIGRADVGEHGALLVEDGV